MLVYLTVDIIAVSVSVGYFSHVFFLWFIFLVYCEPLQHMSSWRSASLLRRKTNWHWPWSDLK